MLFLCTCSDFRELQKLLVIFQETVTFPEEDGTTDIYASADGALDAFENGAVVCR